MAAQKCFACGRRLGKNPAVADTLEDQTVLVGRECYRKIVDAGPDGWQPPAGGPRLYVLTDERRAILKSRGIEP